MGLCISLFKDDKCIYCKVPSSYYINIEHRSRNSCRVSKSGYHCFRNEYII